MGRSPIHPGEHLSEQLDKLTISASELARQLRVPTNRVTETLKGRQCKRARKRDFDIYLFHWGRDVFILFSIFTIW